MDSLVLGDTYVLLCLRFHGLLDNIEKSAPVDSRARWHQPWRWPPCPCFLPSKPSHTPHLMSAFPLLHITSPRDPPKAWEQTSLPAPPPSFSSSTSSPPSSAGPRLHFENLLPQNHCVPSLLPIWLFPMRPPHTGPHRAHRTWSHSFCLWFRHSRPRFELTNNRDVCSRYSWPLLHGSFGLLGVFVTDSINHCRVLSYISALHFHHTAWSFWSKSVSVGTPYFPGVILRF